MYERRQCLPQFAIWYTHQPDCFCLRCVTHKVLIKHPLSRSSFAVLADYDQDPLGDPGQQILESDCGHIQQQIERLRGMGLNVQELLDVDGQPVAAHGPIGGPVGGHVNGQSGFGRTLTLRRLALGDVVSIDPQGPTLTIQLMCSDETMIPVSVTASGTVGALMERVQLNTGTPIERQRLIVAGAELDRHSLLQAAGIINRTFVQLAVTPPCPVEG